MLTSKEHPFPYYETIRPVARLIEGMRLAQQHGIVTPEEAMTREDISVFPLAIPMIAGPGTIATTILYVDLATPHPLDLLAVAAAILSTLLAAWLVMRSSMHIIRLFGRTGILVLSRILGILLAALAIQFILNGLVLFLQMHKFAH